MCAAVWYSVLIYWHPSLVSATSYSTDVVSPLSTVQCLGGCLLFHRAVNYLCFITPPCWVYQPRRRRARVIRVHTQTNYFGIISNYLTKSAQESPFNKYWFQLLYYEHSVTVPLNVKMDKTSDLSEFERSMIINTRRARSIISETEPSCAFQHNSV